MASIAPKHSKPRRKTRRRGVRSEIGTHRVKGVLTRATDRAHAPFLIWDISEEGVGIWLPLELKNGETITLNLGKPKPITVTGRVMWCQMRPGKLGYHAGVMVEEGKNRLISVYRHILEVETFASQNGVAADIIKMPRKKK